MYTAGELERASMAMDEPMKALSHRIMADIVRRIRENGEITSAADWQINRLVQLGMGMAEIQAAIDEALGETENISAVLFKNVIKQGYVRDKKLYKAVGKVQIPFEGNAPLQQLISAVTAQTNETMHNITQSLGFAQRDADGRLSFTPMAKYYQETMDKAMLDISSGAFDYNTVLKRTVKEMTNSGVRTVDYATGWSNRVDVAARRSVMTGMTQLTAKINEQAAEDLDTDWFEISWHGGARPDHWWGGKWYQKEQLKTICKLGDVTGLCGVNCRHSYSPVIPGISEPTYTPEELEELNRQEQQKIPYNGAEYTKYEALQRQRRLETTMRAQREEMALLKEGGASEDDLINCRARYMGTSHEYAEFSKAMGLPQQRERVYADGLGNIMEGKTEGGSGKESPIKVPPVGAKVNSKVTPEERRELLSRNPVNVHNSSIDKSAKGGIIKSENLKMSAPLQKPPDFSKYEVKSDLKAVEAFKETVSAKLGIPISDINLDGIRNTEVLEPFINRIEQIQKETGMKMPALRSLSVIDGDETCIAGYKRYENTLYISSKYFNSKDALVDTLKEWANNGTLPKQGKTIRYLAEHETAHIRIPVSDIESEEGFEIFRKAMKRGLCENDKNIYELYADCEALDRMGYSDKNIQDAVEYLKRRRKK